ncbi:uncharacterized protein LACBIDRAFT_310613 [Laccaria bicolor S238N-H82]|uniref:Predicted protein n=1 Tax=Laccaria bicolor (strain S238N-H82 / ATCC MYA-4686) TaxID=486041 RepID=B0DUQ0_LACBS|nr:uncharacterized protein LACBIDRAFT_310613 [Laccaria bicolor S238N-H82]EDR01580.1 predicted protein [Laccaria bicolor S238N-H82]|eukprot:XP_001887656.1 predicted protein [Laccaria bicolor S238N-H82]
MDLELREEEGAIILSLKVRTSACTTVPICRGEALNNTFRSRYVSCAWTKTIHCEWRKLGSVLEIQRYRLGGVLKGALTRRIVSLTKVFQARS